MPTAAEATTQVGASTTITWINAAGGDWDTASNWDLGRVPGPGDVVINISGITITHAAARADAIHSLTSQAFISLSAGSLTIGGASVINATFTISGGTLFLIDAALGGSGSVVNQGTVVAEGNCVIDVPFTTAVNSALDVVGTNTGTTLTVANGFTNNGLIELTSIGAAASAILAITAGTLTNAVGANITCLAGAGGSRTVSAPLDNQGTIRVAASSTFTLNGPLAEYPTNCVSPTRLPFSAGPTARSRQPSRTFPTGPLRRCPGGPAHARGAPVPTIIPATARCSRCPPVSRGRAVASEAMPSLTLRVRIDEPTKNRRTDQTRD